MGSVGDAYVNAVCGSFFASLECDRVDRFTFKSHSEAGLAVPLQRGLAQLAWPPHGPRLSVTSRHERKHLAA